MTRVGWKHIIVLNQYTPTFRLHRKNVAKIAGSAVSLAVFDRVQEEDSAHFLLNMLDSPDDLFEHIRTEADAVILKITYDYTTEARGSDALVDLAEQSMKDFAEATMPGRWLVNVLPIYE